MSSSLIEEKKSQEYLYLQKVSPKYRDKFLKLIIKYDLEHSPLRIMKDYFMNNEKLNEELRNLLTSREIYLTKISNEFTS